MLDDLNESQRAAVRTTEGPLLVLAGPGTGKTLAIVRRIAYLVTGGVPPESICAITFTNRAAREMAERTRTALGDAGRGLFIGTFHLLGLTILKESLGGGVVLCDREEQERILRESCAIPVREVGRWVERISRVKNLIRQADDEEKAVRNRYDGVLRERKAYDFDDLITVPMELMTRESAPVPARRRFAYVMVDEYQDISPAQHRFLLALLGEGCNVCAVGDADQAIYGFRGADGASFLAFQEDFSGAQRIVLETNYRSTGTIVTASNSLISRNKRRIAKDNRPAGPWGHAIVCVSVPDEKAEGEVIVREIEERMGGTSHYGLVRDAIGHDRADGTCGFGDFAVLCRTNSQVRVMSEHFRTSGIPYQVVGGSLMDRKRDLLRRLRGYVDEAAGHGDVALLLKGLYDEVGLPTEDRAFLDYLLTLFTSLPPEHLLGAVINELTLLTPADIYDPRAEAVSIMTLHMSKGLEFRILFVTGVEEGLIPLAGAEDDDHVEEERRLFYVGMTRAKEELFLLSARSRYLHGRRLNRLPSRFLEEIPGTWVKERFLPDRPKKMKTGKQMGLFSS